MTDQAETAGGRKHAVRVTEQEAAYEIEGMRAVPDRGIPWVERLKGPHPPKVCRAAGAINVLTTSYNQQYMLAYQLADAGLLAGPEQNAEIERDQLKARIDAALAEIAQWWGRGQPGGRTLMAVNSILRGQFAALQGDLPAETDKTWCPRCLVDATDGRYTQESSTQWRCGTCDAVLVVPDPPLTPVLDGRCPNDSPCEHPAMIHDVSGDPEDPKPMCCIDGCTCGQSAEAASPLASPSTVDSGEATAKYEPEAPRG